MYFLSRNYIVINFSVLFVGNQARQGLKRKVAFSFSAFKYSLGGDTENRHAFISVIYINISNDMV